MELVFVCPGTQNVFKSGDFEMTDNNGVITDEDGNRTLDAKVALNRPCPFCGRKHVYLVNELACPFG